MNTPEGVLRAGRWIAIAAVLLAPAALLLQLPGAGLIAPWLFLPGLAAAIALSFVIDRRERQRKRSEGQPGTDSSR